MNLESRESLVQKLLIDKSFRDSFVMEHVRIGVPFQMRTLREERKWTQQDAGESAGKPRNVISRLEDPGYGTMSIKTLLEMASAFDVGLLVKFVPFSRLLKEHDDVSASAIGAASPQSEAKRMLAWARTMDRLDAKQETEELAEGSPAQQELFVSDGAEPEQSVSQPESTPTASDAIPHLQTIAA